MISVSGSAHELGAEHDAVFAELEMTMQSIRLTDHAAVRKQQRGIPGRRQPCSPQARSCGSPSRRSAIRAVLRALAESAVVWSVFGWRPAIHKLIAY
jgi:hypothetical protein